MRPVLCLIALALAGCAGITAVPPRDQAVAKFVAVVARVEPVAERECRSDAPALRCDFKIVIDDRRRQPANAFQSEGPRGRPVITFTLALIEDARNVDELAFIIGHEAAHHIKRHLAIQHQNAVAGAEILGAIAAAHGDDPQHQQSAQRLGAFLGAAAFSKEMELQADALGTIIAAHAGYDPVRGAQYFNRLPDPGDAFLDSHPPNAERLQVVTEVAESL